MKEDDKPINPFEEQTNIKIYSSEVVKNRTFTIIIKNYLSDFEIFNSKQYKTKYIIFNNVLLLEDLLLKDNVIIKKNEYISLCFPLVSFSYALKDKGISKRKGFDSVSLTFRIKNTKKIKIYAYKFMVA